MKIKNLRKYESGWEWTIQYDSDDYEYNNKHQSNEFPNSIDYRTNKNGEGLWMQKATGMNNVDGEYVIATEMRQIEGIGQFSMGRCNTYSSAYNHIKKYMK